MGTNPNMQSVQFPRECVRVILVEANHLNCELVQNALRSRRNGISVLASAISASEALSLLKVHEPDVAVISADLQDGPLEGYRLLRETHALQLRTRVIMLLESRDREFVIDAFRCDARGVVFRDESLETLGKSIRVVHRGQIWANSEHLGYLIQAFGQASPLRLNGDAHLNRLSKREFEVAHLVAEGMTNHQISTRLHLSPHTIKNYLFRIYEKLGVGSRVELALYCLQQRQKRSAATAS